MKKDQNWQFLAIISNIGDILLITMDKQNVPWTMYNYLEKAKNFSFLQIVEYFLQLIWFAHGDQKKIAKTQGRSKLVIFGNFDDFLFIAIGEPNMLQKMLKNMEKADNFSFLQIVEHFLQLIWFPRGKQKKIAKNEERSKLSIFGDFGDILLIAIGKPNVLRKMYSHLEKAQYFSFLHMVEHFLQLIWFPHGKQKKIAKNEERSKLAIFAIFI